MRRPRRPNAKPRRAGVVMDLTPRIRRLVAPNPSAIHLHRHMQLHRWARRGRHHRPRPGQRFSPGGALEGDRRRTRRLYRRHPHPPRPQRARRPPKSRHGRKTCRRAAACLSFRPGEGPRRVARCGLRARPDFARRRYSLLERRDARSRRNAGPRRQPRVFRASRRECPLFRRSCDGVVDLGHRSARRLDDRLHGLAGKAAPAQRSHFFGPATAARSSIPSAIFAPSLAIDGSARRRSWRGSSAAQRRFLRLSRRLTPGSTQNSSPPRACRRWRIWRILSDASWLRGTRASRRVYRRT